MPAVKPTSAQRRRELLLDSANNHAELLLMFGMGDGSLLDDIIHDELLSQKEVAVFAFPGEEACVARFFAKPVIGKLKNAVRFHHITSVRDFDVIVLQNFTAHHHITRLAGCDIVDSHPLTEQAENFRHKHLALFIRTLTDRIGLYGDCIMDSFVGLNNSMLNADTFLSCPDLNDCAGIFGDIPIISIAAGPSLKLHLDELRALQDRCILVACDAVLKGLHSAGIEPHFCTPLERVIEVEPMVDQADGSRTILCGPPLVHPRVLSHFHGRALTVWGPDPLYDWLAPQVTGRVFLGQSTGVLSVTVAHALGRGKVYLVGHDLAYEGDNSHWAQADVAVQGQKKSMAVADARAGNERRMIAGNAGGEVVSFTWWDKFRQQIGMQALRIKSEGRELVNINAHYRRGAVIDHTVAGPLPDPTTLAPMSWPTLPAGKPQRLQDWRERARQLPTDCDAFAQHFCRLETDIDSMLRKPAANWNPRLLAEQINLEKSVSPGNSRAFRYLFGPAFSNCMAEIQLKRKGHSLVQIHHQALLCMKSLCSTLQAASAKLKPELEKNLS
jgi:hypothetical protein